MAAQNKSREENVRVEKEKGSKERAQRTDSQPRSRKDSRIKHM